MWFERPEAELVRAAKAGDRVAFAELLRPEYGTARIAVLQNPAPSRLAKQNSQLQTELVQADSLDLILTKASDDASTLAHA